MIRHILKLIHTQRHNNGWIFAELMVVFILIWLMVDYFLVQGVLYSQPTGQSIDNVYKITLARRPSNSPSFIPYEKESEEPVNNILRIFDRIQHHPDVEIACLSYYSLPYVRSNITGRCKNDTVFAGCVIRSVTPAYFSVFGIRTADGREPEVLSQALRKGAVFSATLAERLYGTNDVRGRYYTIGEDSVRYQVQEVSVPVKGNEYELPVSVRFELLDRYQIKDWTEERLAKLDICFRTRPGIPVAGYAERFKKEMKQPLAIGNFWVSDVRAYEGLRREFLDNSVQASNAKVNLYIGIFFLVNIFLAVIGMFWFRVNRRRSEFGLRMSVGSTRRDIMKMMILEGLLLLTLMAIPGVIIGANLYWLGILPEKGMALSTGRFVAVSVITWVLLAAVIILAIWYPARKASRLAPAEALHYE